MIIIDVKDKIRRHLVLAGLGHDLAVEFQLVDFVFELVEVGIVQVLVASITPDAEIGETQRHHVTALQSVHQHVFVHVSAEDIWKVVFPRNCLY